MHTAIQLVHSSYLCCLLLACENRPYRQKGFEEVHLNPPFGLKSTTLNPTICKWPTSFAAIENHAPLLKQVCLQLYNLLVHGGPVDECVPHA